jgi:hypothetical protein
MLLCFGSQSQACCRQALLGGAKHVGGVIIISGSRTVICCTQPSSSSSPSCPFCPHLLPLLQGICHPTAPVVAMLTDECVEHCNNTNINFHVFGFETLAPIRFGRVDIKYRQVILARRSGYLVSVGTCCTPTSVLLGCSRARGLSCQLGTAAYNHLYTCMCCKPATDKRHFLERCRHEAG